MSGFLKPFLRRVRNDSFCGEILQITLPFHRVAHLPQEGLSKALIECAVVIEIVGSYQDSFIIEAGNQTHGTGYFSANIGMMGTVYYVEQRLV